MNNALNCIKDNFKNDASSQGDDCVEKSTLVSKNITVLGRRTSVRLEPEMWRALNEIADRENSKIHDICSLIDLQKNHNTSFTAAIRVFLMLYYRAAATEDGHNKANHGSLEQMMTRVNVLPGMLAAKPVDFVH